MLFTLLSFIVFIHILIFFMNEISDRLCGTTYNQQEKKVKFGQNEIKTYNLSSYEKRMKKKAFRKNMKLVDFYRQVDQLTYMMDNLTINPNLSN